jgi:tetratricopeptide (TPR) repeat protein
MWFRVGQAWATNGNLDAAISALEKSLAIDSHQPEPEKVLALVHGRRGVERTLAGNTAGAMADLETAVKLDPGSAQARLNLAAVLAERGDISRARTLAQEALALQPGYEKALALLRALDGK